FSNKPWRSSRWSRGKPSKFLAWRVGKIGPPRPERFLTNEPPSSLRNSRGTAPPLERTADRHEAASPSMTATLHALHLLEPFRIAHGASTTRTVLRLHREGLVAEAPFVPYYGDDPEETLARFDEG